MNNCNDSKTRNKYPSLIIIFTSNITNVATNFSFLFSPLLLSLFLFFRHDENGASSPNGGQNRTQYSRFSSATTDSYCFLIGGRARAFENAPRERRPSLPLFPSAPVCPRKKVSLEIFSIKNRRRAPGRGSPVRRCQKPGTRRDASRRCAPPAPRCGGRGRGRGRGRVSFNYCSIVTHGPFQ